jgi:hypothetical protein
MLALERGTAGVTPADFAPLLQAEARALWTLMQADVVRGAWFDASRHTAVLLLECGSVDEAHRHLDGLPLVAAGLITFELIPLVPYDGFERLFIP